MSNFRVRPLGNYVHIRLDAAIGQTSLAIPESAKKASLEINPIGTVLAVGPGMPMDGGRLYPIDVKPGDRVQLLRVMAPVVRDRQAVADEFLCDHSQILAVLEPIEEETEFERKIREARDGDMVPTDAPPSKLVLVP